MDPKTLRYYSQKAHEVFDRYDSSISYWDMLKGHFPRRFEYEAKMMSGQRFCPHYHSIP